MLDASTKLTLPTDKPFLAIMQRLQEKSDLTIKRALTEIQQGSIASLLGVERKVLVDCNAGKIRGVLIALSNPRSRVETEAERLARIAGTKNAKRQDFLLGKPAHQRSRFFSHQSV